MVAKAMDWLRRLMVRVSVEGLGSLEPELLFEVMEKRYYLPGVRPVI
jgi:hypothetical protein